MPSPSDPGRPGLAERFRAIGYPVRLELLDLLRFPRTLGEIRVRPGKVAGGGDRRPAARQTVQHHLDQLVEAGLVRVSAVERGGKSVPQYVADVPRLYALAEELRRLSARPNLGPGADATGTLPGPDPAAAMDGPRLVLAHGAYEGRAYALDPGSASPEGRWVIGRRRGVAVCLDYDPYVSQENAAVAPRDGGFVLADLGPSKNGTSLNWVPLPRGGTRRLQAGDLVGVGRSLLCFAD